LMILIFEAYTLKIPLQKQFNAYLLQQ